MKPSGMKKPVPQANEEQAVNHNEIERQITISEKNLITHENRTQPETLDQSDQGTGRTMATRKIRGFDPAHLQSSRMGEEVHPWGHQEARGHIRKKAKAGREHGAIETKARP